MTENATGTKALQLIDGDAASSRTSVGFPHIRNFGDREHAVLITGGAGFIGTNLAHSLLTRGKDVVIYDNFSRKGVKRNFEWLRERHGKKVSLCFDDIRDSEAIKVAMERVSQVYHFAAQVAVTSSLTDPLTDFEINLRGTLNVLEAVRSQENPPSIVFTSTNKVYGDLASLTITQNDSRYEPVDEQMKCTGIGSNQGLSFHSPYGCSKGGADQYVLDYAKSYGISSVVFRMSCIYGPHQMGTEDQGWVAHFILSVLLGKPITLYGDGMQVRDILYINDLVEALTIAQDNAASLAGQAFTIGGGQENAITLRTLLDIISSLNGNMPPIEYSEWRRGDQRYFVADTSAFREITGWNPRTGFNKGIELLYRWLVENNINAQNAYSQLSAQEGVVA
ncbi:MAG: SDR family NAD(P)-dependent oxidoreductase [Chitinivibrionales bacterium]|nr:SDR family NAD(P)-dependent oxidoreductase [Chitinivibrionales bacterium]